MFKTLKIPTKVKARKELDEKTKQYYEEKSRTSTTKAFCSKYKCSPENAVLYLEASSFNFQTACTNYEKDLNWEYQNNSKVNWK